MVANEMRGRKSKADFDTNEAIEVRAGLATTGADVKTTAGANCEHHLRAANRSHRAGWQSVTLVVKQAGVALQMGLVNGHVVVLAYHCQARDTGCEQK